VVAATPEQALDTMHRLQATVEEEVEGRQEELALEDGEEFTSVRYDQGESIETTSSRLRRALVAVLAAGLILTTGAVIAFDAIARWRRSRSPAAQAEAGEPRRRYMYGGLPASTNGRSSAPEFGEARKPNQESWPLPVKLPEPTSPAPVSPAPATDHVPANEQTQKLAIGELTQKLPSPAGPPEESTIILPLANVPWAGQKKNGDSKP
jgi:hypothetical protein